MSKFFYTFFKFSHDPTCTILEGEAQGSDQPCVVEPSGSTHNTRMDLYIYLVLSRDQHEETKPRCNVTLSHGLIFLPIKKTPKSRSEDIGIHWKSISRSLIFSHQKKRRAVSPICLAREESLLFLSLKSSASQKANFYMKRFVMPSLPLSQIEDRSMEKRTELRKMVLRSRLFFGFLAVFMALIVFATTKFHLEHLSVFHFTNFSSFHAISSILSSIGLIWPLTFINGCCLLQLETLGGPFASSKVRDRESIKGAPVFSFRNFCFLILMCLVLVLVRIWSLIGSSFRDLYLGESWKRTLTWSWNRCGKTQG